MSRSKWAAVTGVHNHMWKRAACKTAHPLHSWQAQAAPWPHPASGGGTGLGLHAPSQGVRVLHARSQGGHAWHAPSQGAGAPAHGSGPAHAPCQGAHGPRAPSPGVRGPHAPSQGVGAPAHGSCPARGPCQGDPEVPAPSQGAGAPAHGPSCHAARAPSCRRGDLPPGPSPRAAVERCGALQRASPAEVNNGLVRSCSCKRSALGHQEFGRHHCRLACKTATSCSIKINAFTDTVCRTSAEDVQAAHTQSPVSCREPFAACSSRGAVMHVLPDGRDMLGTQGT